MKKFVLVLLMFAIGAQAQECKPQPVRIAVIDTGLSFSYHTKVAKLCNTGHRDFSITKLSTNLFKTKDLVPKDLHGHGTNVVGIIEARMKESKTDYCLIIVKYWDANMTHEQTMWASAQAFAHINFLKPDIVNYSAGGVSFEQNEYKLVRRYLDSGGILVAAAGNNGQNLDLDGNTYYPAMYDKRIVVVGNITNQGLYAPSSNFGKRITRWEFGQNINAYGVTMTGTSQSTAQATGKIARQIKKPCVQ